ncbi:MAG TPA: hypothetical protein VMR14_24045 [Streptosporangiaceae bacterium]|nr:hypothetical protein [Streptosporangiaceae bacterium]
MGRDVGRDEGRDQATWRDLVARLELPAPIDPADTPWPDRENLTAKSGPVATAPDDLDGPGRADGVGASDGLGVSDGLGGPEALGGSDGAAGPEALGGPDAPARRGKHRSPGEDLDGTDPQATSASASAANEADGSGPGTCTDDDDQGETGTEGNDPGSKPRHGKKPAANRSRVIRPAGFTRFCGPGSELTSGAGQSCPEAIESGADAAAFGFDAADADSDDGPGQGSGPRTRSATSDPSGTTPAGPRDYGVADPDDFVDDEFDDRYVPPPVPPQPKLDPVAKGAWIALFGGPGYLLVATLLNWQLAGWTELAAVTAFIVGFIVLVFRLGDGPSKRDGPDQGAVV